MPVSYVPEPVQEIWSSTYEPRGWMHGPPPPATVILDLLNVSGRVGLIVFTVDALAGSHNSYLVVNCDALNAFYFSFLQLNNFGLTADSPRVSLPAYGVNAFCCMVLTKEFRFTDRFTCSVVNGAAQNGNIWVHPDLR